MSNSQKIAQTFIEYLKEEGQYSNLPEIADALQKEANRQKEITVISAEQLSQSEQRDLEKTLVARWGDHPVIYTVDPVIISGMIIAHRDVVIDLSGKNQLQQLKQELE